MLLSDPRVAAVPVRDSGEPLTELDESFGSSRALVRVSVARRLALARAGLPKGLGLRVTQIQVPGSIGDTVVGQKPTAGQIVAQGHDVTIYVGG